VKPSAVDQLGEQLMTVDGLVTLVSALSPKDTMDRVEAEVVAKGMTVFARVDHSGGAEAVGLPLRPTALLVFGNARGGTPLMQAVQTIGIDLPLKILVWQDADGRTQLGYNDPQWLAKRHGLGSQAETATKAMRAALEAITQAATSSDDP
jgi:uncharacterized protein (DUF302 family)